MSFTHTKADDIVFIAFSDTHGNRARLSRLHSLIKETIEKDKTVNPNIKHVLLIPGDVFSVNAAFSVISNGKFDIDVITAIANLFPEDGRFFTPGNHDYFYEETQLIELVTKAKFQTIISNTEFKTTSHLRFQKTGSVVCDDETLTLGGLMTPETLNTPGAKKVISDAKSIKLNPMLEDEKQSLPAILMSHLGFRSDVDLPYKTTIVGGHSHDKQIKQLADKLVVNTGAGDCAIVLRKRGKKAELKETKDFKPSEEVEAIVKHYGEKYKDKINLTEKLFTIDAKSITPAGLEIEDVKNTVGHLRISDTMVMRITADGILASLKKAGAKVDFVLYPSAAIRSNFEPGQVVNEEELLETYYYANKLVEVTLTGGQLVELLAHGVMSGYKCCTNRGQLLTPSRGLTYEYDIEQKNPGDTIRWVKVNGKFINLQEKFVIVTTDWVAADIKKRFPVTTQKTYEDLKIYKLVGEELKGTIHTEKFSERITAAQDFQTQQALSLLPGNRRADEPGFNKFTVSINLAHHQAHYLKENTPHYSQSANTTFAASAPPPSPASKEVITKPETNRTL